MCGRLTLYSPWADLYGWYSLIPSTSSLNLRARYNFCPTERAPIVVKDGDGLTVRPMHWGILQFWAKDRKAQAKTINARIETIRGLKSYQEPFKRRRCLVPASGYYEWMIMPDKTKQPFYFTPKAEPVFSFAGIHHTWKDPAADGKEIETFVIVTKPPTPQISAFHDRMPAMLEQERWNDWLNLDVQDEDATNLLLRDYPHPIHIHAVSTRVSSNKNDDADIITEVPSPVLL